MTTSIGSDHERHHKAAYLRVRRIRTIEHIGLIAAAALAVTAIVTGAAGSLAGAGVLAAALAVWHYLGRVDNAVTRETVACRTEYAAYMARSAGGRRCPQPRRPAAGAPVRPPGPRRSSSALVDTHPVATRSISVSGGPGHPVCTADVLGRLPTHSQEQVIQCLTPSGASSGTFPRWRCTNTANWPCTPRSTPPPKPGMPPRPAGARPEPTPQPPSPR